MTGTDGAGPLAVLGLSSAQAAAYELLVDHPGASAGELAAAWLYAEPVAEVLDGLRATGLAQASADQPARYVAVAPRVAFDAQLADRWRALHDLRDRVDQLARELRAHADGAGVVEVVVGPAAVHERLTLALRSTRRELRRLGGPRPVDPAVVEVERELLARRMECRILGPEPAAVHPAGALARRCGTAPVTMYLVDDRLAVLPTDPDRYGTTAAVLVVHRSELLHALSLLFEGLWEEAGAPQRPARPEPGRLVELLLAGLTDDAISRALGVSPRTVQRRIAAMMAAAGARTRFQAGVQAALRQSRSGS
jgi:hypothetical protein